MKLAEQVLHICIVIPDEEPVSDPEATVEASKVDQVGKFWVVTAPSDVSELGDILFEIDVPGMMRQALGGLKDDRILGIYKDKSAAAAHANKLLDSIKG
jgi:hypothetical protein